MGNTGTSGPILGIEAVGMGFAGAVGNAAFGFNVPIAASGVADGITDQSRIVPEVPWFAVASLAIEHICAVRVCLLAAVDEAYCICFVPSGADRTHAVCRAI